MQKYILCQPFYNAVSSFGIWMYKIFSAVTGKHPVGIKFENGILKPEIDITPSVMLQINKTAFVVLQKSFYSIQGCNFIGMQVDKSKIKNGIANFCLYETPVAPRESVRCRNCAWMTIGRIRQPVKKNSSYHTALTQFRIKRELLHKLIYLFFSVAEKSFIICMH